jgi:hypothetical protein
MTSTSGTAGTNRDNSYLSPYRDNRDSRDTPLGGVSRCVPVLLSR